MKINSSFHLDKSTAMKQWRFKKLALIILMLFIANTSYAGNTYNFYFDDDKNAESSDENGKKKIQVTDDKDDDKEDIAENEEQKEDEDEEYTGPISFSGRMHEQQNIQRPGLIQGLFSNASRDYVSFGLSAESSLSGQDGPAMILRAKFLPILTLEGVIPSSDDQKDQIYRFGGILESDHTKSFAFQLNFGTMHSGGETSDYAPYIGLGYRIRLFNHLDISIAGGKLLKTLTHQYKDDWGFNWSQSQWNDTDEIQEEKINGYFSAGFSIAFPFGKGII